VPDPDALDHLRVRLGTVIVAAYLVFAAWNALDPQVSVPPALNLAVGAVIAWLYKPVLIPRRKRRDR
jgi:ABC-type transport system involved in cytochrome bd biosynthesis fused ATPase/permease subunit